MESEETSEFVRGHPDGLKDAVQSSLEKVFAAVNWDDSGPSIGMAHHVMAAIDPCRDETGALKSPDDLCSRYGRNAAWHKAANYQESGHVECQSQLIRWPDLLKKQF